MDKIKLRSQIIHYLYCLDLWEQCQSKDEINDIEIALANIEDSIRSLLMLGV